MKIIITHNSPDLDAITSVWLLRRFLPGWQDAPVQFVPAGERIGGVRPSSSVKNEFKDVIENIDKDEIIHVDTGFGPLDHHLTPDETVSAASLTWEYVKKHSPEFSSPVSESAKVKERAEAILQMVKVVVDIDHFKEVAWEDPKFYYHDFSLWAILEGLKYERPNEDNFFVEFVSQCLDTILHNFENRIWAEREISEKGQIFETRWGKGLGLETINDSTIKLAQKMGYQVVVRKDPRKGYVRIKARPSLTGEKEIDLTLVCEKLKKMDPDATWFLHVSNKMLLNGTAKNPKMRPSKLSLSDIIEVLKKI